MKTTTRIIAVSLAASLTFVSYAKQEVMDNGNADSVGEVRTIAVSFANGSTKSALDGLHPKFVAGDVIKISNCGAYEDCTVSIDGSGNASITTSLTGALKMVYPAIAAKMSGNAIEGVIVPTVQDGSFASANICKASIAEGAIEASFENQTAIFKLYAPAKVDERGVDYVAKSLAIKSIGENNIADGCKEITLGDGTSTIFADENGFYYVSVLPGETASNLYVCAGAGARKLTGNDAITKNSLYSVALPVLNGHEYVEITMTVGETTKTYKWATMNIGAKIPEDYGDYFAWGETEGRTAVTTGPAAFAAKPFNWANAPFNNCSSSFDAAYFIEHKSEWLDGNDTNGYSLKPEYDAANVNWGGIWRMPTSAEFKAMKDATFWAWDATDGGYYVFAPNPATDAGKINTQGTGKYIKTSALLFFPAAGYGAFANIGYAGSYGSYWSSTLYSSYPGNAYDLFLYGNVVYLLDYGELRICGLSVRPISD